MKIIKLREDSSVLIDGVTQTVNHEFKNQKGLFLCCFFCYFKVQLLLSLVLKDIARRGVKGAGRGSIDTNF